MIPILRPRFETGLRWGIVSGGAKFRGGVNTWAEASFLSGT